VHNAEHSDILSALGLNTFKDMRFVTNAWGWLLRNMQQCRISIFNSNGNSHFQARFKSGAKEARKPSECQLRWALPSEELQQQLLEQPKQLLQALHREYSVQHQEEVHRPSCHHLYLNLASVGLTRLEILDHQGKKYVPSVTLELAHLTLIAVRVEACLPVSTSGPEDPG
jgi:HPt (histidine-containing phosphotransfer) domain-containing protein